MITTIITTIILMLIFFPILWGLLKLAFKITWGVVKFTGFLLMILAAPVFFIILFAAGISALLILPILMLFAGVPMFRWSLI